MIEYTYKGQPVEILWLDMDESETPDPQDFVPYVSIKLPNGTIATAHASSIQPDPVRILMGVPQVHTFLHCGAYTQVDDGQPDVCRECGEVVKQA